MVDLETWDMLSEDVVEDVRQMIGHRLGGHHAALSHAARLGYPPALVEGAAATLIRAAECEVLLGLLQGLLDGYRAAGPPGPEREAPS